MTRDSAAIRIALLEMRLLVVVALFAFGTVVVSPMLGFGFGLGCLFTTWARALPQLRELKRDANSDQEV